MKNIVALAILLTLFLACSKQSNAANLKSKNKTIGSLKNELRDCKSQAQIIADVMENERKEEQRQETTR